MSAVPKCIVWSYEYAEGLRMRLLIRPDQEWHFYLHDEKLVGEEDLYDPGSEKWEVIEAVEFNAETARRLGAVLTFEGGLATPTPSPPDKALESAGPAIGDRKEGE